MHTYILTYGLSIMFLYDANFTMMEVASSANNCAICHYNIYQDTFSTYDTQFLYVIGFHGFTTWKVSKYRVISGPYFPVFSPNPGKYGPEVTLYLDTFHTVLYINCFQSFWFQLSSWYFPVMGGVKRVGGGWWWCVGVGVACFWRKGGILRREGYEK